MGLQGGCIERKPSPRGEGWVRAAPSAETGAGEDWPGPVPQAPLVLASGRPAGAYLAGVSGRRIP